jgi:hypothetical protein
MHLSAAIGTLWTGEYQDEQATRNRLYALTPDYREQQNKHPRNYSSLQIHMVGWR